MVWKVQLLEAVDNYPVHLGVGYVVLELQVYLEVVFSVSLGLELLVGYSGMELAAGPLPHLDPGQLGPDQRQLASGPQSW